MAATKTSLVLFLFALIAVSANMQMASALLPGLPVPCLGLEAKVEVAGGCSLNTDCIQICKTLYPTRVLSVSLCVPGLISATVDGCSCCFNL
ncbi:hypothetical protein C5167_000652 [Papaver somniferum]|uniref:Hydrophobic seed protein domain-containing protein n=1 Tax=Papaver somniferum TaxID=3469 RepID=A0A4Y7I9Z9_PAPSO|nr:hypothetical protein C5167_037596 [Papaver somniferum]RZC44642.1 hypothetical protein C5167_037593 [Papaver somniferum]RZC44644.1 hypothetical protein C5167_037592 [Papaver somniferum]RZC76559.1 hypothetical protein C5167_000652 [Papaver somniferum]